MDWATLLERAGPVVAGIAAVSSAAWFLIRAQMKTIQHKDAEIARVNEERIKEKQAATDQLLRIVQDFNSLQAEANRTLDQLSRDLGRT